MKINNKFAQRLSVLSIAIVSLLTLGYASAAQALVYYPNPGPMKPRPYDPTPVGTEAYCVNNGGYTWIYYPNTLDLWGFDLVNPTPTAPVSAWGYLVYSTVVGRNDIDPGQPDPTPGVVSLYISGENLYDYSFVNYDQYPGWYTFKVYQKNFTRAYWIRNATSPDWNQEVPFTCVNK